MPRIEFNSYSNAKEFLNKVIAVSDKGYIAYLTDEHELILVPSKSTQPIIYGYVKRITDLEAKDFSK